jgi:nucleoside-diphosphate-sugar epimerase
MQDKEIQFVNIDIRDRSKVEDVMKGVDVVHHNVALVPLTKSGSSFWSVNVEGAKIAAESAKKAGVHKFIHMSSSAIYGLPSEFPITAKTPTKPIEIYGIGKLAGENAIKSVFANSSVQYSIIRPRTILGKGRMGIFQILFEWIAQNKTIYTIGNGQNLFQFVHAKDLINAYMLTLKSEISGEYNIGTQNFSTINEAFMNLIQHANSESKIRNLPEKISIGLLQSLDALRLSPLAPWHYKTFHKPFYFEMAPLVNLGWESTYSNDQMLSESYDWFLANRYGQTKDNFSPHRKNVAERGLKILRKFS